MLATCLHCRVGSDRHPEQAVKAELLLKAHNENDPSNSYNSSVNKVGKDSLRSWCHLRTESGVIRWQENVLRMQPLRPLTLGLFCGSLGPVPGSVPSVLHLSEVWGLPPTILLTNSLFCTSPSGLCIQVALAEPVPWAAQVGAKLLFSCWESFSGKFCPALLKTGLLFSPHVSLQRKACLPCSLIKSCLFLACARLGPGLVSPQSVAESQWDGPTVVWWWWWWWGIREIMHLEVICKHCQGILSSGIEP